MSRWTSLLAVQEHDTRADQLNHRIQTLPIRGELSKLEGQLAGARADREAAAADVPAELWPEYDKLRGRLGGVAIARLVGPTCQGCHLALSAVEVDRIRKLPLDEAVYCEECGRLLVRD